MFDHAQFSRSSASSAIAELPPSTQLHSQRAMFQPGKFSPIPELDDENSSLDEDPDWGTPPESAEDKACSRQTKSTPSWKLHTTSTVVETRR